MGFIHYCYLYLRRNEEIFFVALLHIFSIVMFFMEKSIEFYIRRSFIYCLPILLSLSFQNLYAQLDEDFSSGSLSTNNWSGDTDLFIINGDEQLQLNNTDPESNNLTTLRNSVTTGDSTHWSFSFSYDFSPSSSNYAEFVLAADNPDFDNYFGYFIKLGGISGADDAVELFRKDGNSQTLLLSGSMGTLGTSTVNATIRCIRDNNGNWTLELDEQGGSDFTLEGTVFDNTYPLGNEIGLRCQYSSTRADKFFFDDFLIGPAYSDDDPAQLLDFEIVTENQLRLTFNEPLATNSLQSTNFGLIPNSNFSSIGFANSENSQIQLTMNDVLVDGQQYELTIKNIEDLASNVLGDTILTFDYLKIENPAVNDIVINEIMADPTPSVGLPEVEFIELFNRSDKNFQLGAMTFADASSEFVITDYVLEKGAYVILYKEDGANSYPTLNNKIGISNFPAIGNSGDELTLYDNVGIPINAVNYDISWYNNVDRDEGGYSLELIDADRICLGSNNWQASTSNLGGTPGSKNANTDLNIEEIPFRIEKIFPLQSNSISIVFNRALSTDVLTQTEVFQADGFVTNSVIALSNQLDVFEVSFDRDFEINTVYEFCLKSGAKDCEGDPISSDICKKFGVPIQPKVGDILINEILPNPATGGSDFLELINPTNNIYDLGNLFLANVDSNDVPDQVNPITDQFIMLPNDLIVLTENPVDILARYSVPVPGNIIEMDLPTFGDKDGTAILMLSDFPAQLDLDRLDYSEDWHNPLLDIKDGVSLERISVLDETKNASNWRSASQTSNFATPTGENSQSIEVPENSESPFSFEQKRLSPDDDGFEDFLGITYQESEGDFLINIKIFDIQGRLVKELANNFSAGRQAFFRWDGDVEDGSKGRMGIYILWLERFSSEGLVERFTEQIVLAEKLN